MDNINNNVGYFVFSLDTELAWGGLWNQLPKKTSRNGSAERKTILRLLDLMDEFGIVATWAITGHLFYEKCEECEYCPIMVLKGKDVRFEQIWGSQETMWYGADVVKMIHSRSCGHEIAFHGYTHRVFDSLTRDEARFEIQEWLRLGKRKDLIPQTVIFPQGRIDHLDIFEEAGFVCYRGKEIRHPALSFPLLGKVLNRINLGLSFLTPQVFEVNPSPRKLINIPSSQWLFRTNRRIEMILDFLNLPFLRFHQVIKAIEKAAKEKKVIHLWVHPHEFRTEKDFEKLRYVFIHYANLAKQGKLKSITMIDLAKQSLGTNNAYRAESEES
jgi:hypothetical protein